MVFASLFGVSLFSLCLSLIPLPFLQPSLYGSSCPTPPPSPLPPPVSATSPSPWCLPGVYVLQASVGWRHSPQAAEHLPFFTQGGRGEWLPPDSHQQSYHRQRGQSQGPRYSATVLIEEPRPRKKLASLHRAFVHFVQATEILKMSFFYLLLSFGFHLVKNFSFNSKHQKKAQFSVKLSLPSSPHVNQEKKVCLIYFIFWLNQMLLKSFFWSSCKPCLFKIFFCTRYC